MLKQFILDQSLIHWPPCGLGEQGPSPNIKLKLFQVGILVDDQTFSIGRFPSESSTFEPGLKGGGKAWYRWLVRWTFVRTFASCS